MAQESHFPEGAVVAVRIIAMTGDAERAAAIAPAEIGYVIGEDVDVLTTRGFAPDGGMVQHQYPRSRVAVSLFEEYRKLSGLINFLIERNIESDHVLRHLVASRPELSRLLDLTQRAKHPELAGHLFLFAMMALLGRETLEIAECSEREVQESLAALPIAQQMHLVALARNASCVEIASVAAGSITDPELFADALDVLAQRPDHRAKRRERGAERLVMFMRWANPEGSIGSARPLTTRLKAEFLRLLQALESHYLPEGARNIDRYPTSPFAQWLKAKLLHLLDQCSIDERAAIARIAVDDAVFSLVAAQIPDAATLETIATELRGRGPIGKRLRIVERRLQELPELAADDTGAPSA